MMGYRRMNMSVRPVQRIKHIVDASQTSAAAANTVIVVAQATDTPTLGATNSVITGSKINGIFLNVQVVSNEASQAGAIPNVYFALVKNPMGDITSLNITSLGDDDRKRYVLHQEMTMIEDNRGGNAKTLFKGVIVIPKGMRRMGPSDTLEVHVRTTTVDINLCMQCIYKEFR